jgi:hypothetical protein
MQVRGVKCLQKNLQINSYFTWYDIVVFMNTVHGLPVTVDKYLLSLIDYTSDIPVVETRARAPKSDNAVYYASFSARKRTRTKKS